MTQSSTTAPFELPVWPGEGRREVPVREQWFSFADAAPFLRNVTRPTLTVYLPAPDHTTGTAVIVCPGGAYHTLSMETEGEDMARWLNGQGVAGIVLKYRLVPTPPDHQAFLASFSTLLSSPSALRTVADQHAPTILKDGQQAVRVVRAHASEWGLRPDRIGMLGFSAGGHLSGLVAQYHDTTTRPDFVASIYGLHGEAPVVPADACPLFVMYAQDDPFGAVITETSQALYTAWREAGVPAELHAYPRGGHGFGMRRQNLLVDGWAERFHEWLVAHDAIQTHAPSFGLVSTELAG